MILSYFTMNFPDLMIFSIYHPESSRNYIRFDEFKFVHLYDLFTSNDNPGLINPKRLFNWGDTIKKYQITTIWGVTPFFNKPWFSLIRGWHYSIFWGFLNSKRSLKIWGFLGRKWATPRHQTMRIRCEVVRVRGRPIRHGICGIWGPHFFWWNIST